MNSNKINKKKNGHLNLDPIEKSKLKNGVVSGMQPPRSQPSDTDDSLVDGRNMKGTFTSQSTSKILHSAEIPMDRLQLNE